MAEFSGSGARRVVIAGGSGFLGLSLARHLAALGYDVTLLSRRPPRPSGPWKHVVWDARTAGEWRRELEGAWGVVNLAGRNVDCIKTPDHQDEILRSRVEATCALGAALRGIDSPPPVWVQMSSAHIYGDPPEVMCTEDSAFGYGLAPFVARAWEDAFHASVLPSQRAVILRTSFVLGRDQGAGAGALSRLGKLAKLGLGGTIGPGTQGLSWIHERDLNRLFARALDEPAMIGVYIASSPNPVSSKVFMRELRRAVGMPIGLPTSEWMVRFGARWFLRTDPELALYGRYVVSTRLQEEQFEFEFPELGEALDDLLRAAPQRPGTSSPPSRVSNARTMRGGVVSGSSATLPSA
ncbi:MAG: DUF1731 domain-containing protein [Planctomycetia bacterium]|nr:DUF1731 domain-containing protein [Planctomycetia bacterium]